MYGIVLSASRGVKFAREIIDPGPVLMPYQSQHLYVAENATPGREVAPMDFTALRYFSATAHSRSIRAASDRLHVSPSAISRQIAKLEHELRAPIFDRRAQGMKLTAAGEILLSKIDGVMSEFSRVKSHIAALQDLKAGNVDVCCFQTAVESFVVPVLNRFHAQYPDVQHRRGNGGANCGHRGNRPYPQCPCS